MTSVLTHRFRIGLIAIIIGILISSAGALPAQERGNDSLRNQIIIGPESKGPDMDIVSAGVQFAPSAGEGSFFREYRKLGGTRAALGGIVFPTIAVRAVLAEGLRVIVSAGYGSATFGDIYAAIDTADGRRQFAAITEDFSVSIIPVLVGLEFAPIRSQFTSYVGVQAGMGMNNVRWTTVVRNESFADFYRPESNLKGFGISPAFRIYTGVDLRFDRFFTKQNPFRGIFLEGSYSVLPVSRDYFAAIRKGGKALPQSPSDDGAAMNLGGLTLTLGVNLQYQRR